MPKKKSPLAAEQEIKATLVRLPHGLWMRLRTHGLRINKSANAMIQSAVADYLKKENA